MEQGERIWDYSTLSSFQTCRRKYYYEHVRNLKPKVKGIALAFGTGIHEALDAYYKNPARDMQAGIEAFKKVYQDREGDDLRTVANGIKLLEHYAKKYLNEPFKVLGKPEEGFAFPIGDVLFAGRLDLPVEWDGQVWMMEHKTTTRLTGGYFNQFELDKQLTGYTLAAEEFLGKKCLGCIVNVMEPWKEVIRKTAKTKSPEDHFLRKPMPRSTLIKDRFKLNVQRLVRDILWCEQENEFYEAEKKEVCQYYARPCPYANLCLYGEDERMIKNDFIVEKWSPLTGTATEVTNA